MKPHKTPLNVIFASLTAILLASCGNVDSIDSNIDEMNEAIQELKTTMNEMSTAANGVNESMNSFNSKADFMLELMIPDLDDDEENTQGESRFNQNAKRVVAGNNKESANVDSEFDLSTLPKISKRECTDSKAATILASVIDYANFKNIDDAMEETVPIPTQPKFRRLDMITSDIQSISEDKKEAFVWVVLKPMFTKESKEDHVAHFPRTTLKCIYHWIEDGKHFDHVCVGVKDPKDKKSMFALRSFRSDLTVNEDSDFCIKKYSGKKSTEIRYTIDFEIDNDEVDALQNTILKTIPLGELLGGFVKKLFTGDRFVKWYFKRVFPLWLQGAEKPQKRKSL